MLAAFSGGGGGLSAKQPGESPRFASFREIPGVTEDEIREVEKLQEQVDYFVYGMIISTEMFHDSRKNEINGFSVLVSEWLTELFGIPFMPVVYKWDDLISGLESGDVDFTGELTPTEERLKKYHMTDPIAQRMMRYFRLTGSQPIAEIAKERRLRFAMLKDSIIYDYVVSSGVYDDFEAVFVDNEEDAYPLLKSGKVDAYIDESVMEAVFDAHGDIISVDFFPLRSSPVSLTTHNPELEPIISVVQKALQAGETSHLAELYRIGEKEFRRHKLYMALNDEERAFLRGNPVIPFVAEHYNYPIAFYNRYKKQWQGIFFDVLEEVTKLTGLSFKRINDQHMQWPELLSTLESGKAYMIAELIPTKERRELGFLWPDTPTMADRYALLSKLETPKVSLKNVVNARVGMARGTAYAEKFRSWFPDHPYAVMYESSNAAFSGLDRGEVDMVISSQRRLLAITNYHELPGYKANIVFDQISESFIGFNKDQEVLRSIFNKALAIIDVQGIAEQWMLQTYDYKGQIARAQRPWLIGATILLLGVLALLFILFQKSRNEGKKLEVLVQERTAEAQAANKAKSDFLANMSHEMRTPLNAVIGLSGVVLQTDNIDAESRKNIEAIYNAGSTLLDTVNDILDLSKIEAGKLELVPDEYDVPSVINDTVTQNIMRIHEKPVELVLELDGDMFARLYGDELKIRQLMNNLLSNAIKYTKEGTVTLNISARREDESVWLTIQIRDTGVGIRQEDIGKLFKDYTQVDKKANRGIEGTGLGLSLVKSITKLMDGSVSVESEYGKGSVFTARVRQQFINDIRIGPDIAENLKNFRYSNIGHVGKQDRYISLPYAHVLVVDDNMTNLAVAKGMMKPYGMNIDCVDAGQKAVNAIRDEKVRYNAVFMDHMMPGMDGIEAVRLIRGLGTDYARNIPVIALTANAIAGSEEMFLSSGFQDFLPKPIKHSRLDEVIRRWVRDEEKEKASVGQEHASAGPKAQDSGSGIAGRRIAGLDIAKGIEQFGGDEGVYLDVLRSFTVNTRRLLESMENVSADTLADYAITVHGIKGSSMGICANLIGGAAKKLEDASKAGDLGYVAAHNRPFLDAAWELVNDLDDMFASMEGAGQKPRKDKPDSGLLSKLAAACEAFDMEEVLAAMDQIRRFEYEADDGLASWLQDNVDKMNFTQIANKLNGKGEE